MAMTKTEKERMERLERDIKLAKAMRWPGYPKPSPLTKAEIDCAKVAGGVRHGRAQMITRGWFGNCYDRGQVSYGCSDGTNHNSDGDTTSTQGMGRMYATEADAWRAIRVEMTERFAGTLARIDDEIIRCTVAAPEPHDE